MVVKSRWVGLFFLMLFHKKKEGGFDLTYTVKLTGITAFVEKRKCYCVVLFVFLIIAN